MPKETACAETFAPREQSQCVERLACFRGAGSGFSLVDVEGWPDEYLIAPATR